MVLQPLGLVTGYKERRTKINVWYTPLIGFPLCVLCMIMGVFFCITIIGIPLGLACFTLGTKVITLNK